MLKVFYKESSYRNLEGSKNLVDSWGLAFRIYHMTPDKYTQIYEDNGLAQIPIRGYFCEAEQEKQMDKYAVAPTSAATEELFTKKINNSAKIWGKEELYQNKILGFANVTALYNWLQGYSYETGDVRGDVKCVDNDAAFDLKKDTFVFPNFQSYIRPDAPLALSDTKNLMTDRCEK